jgi:hypothetical protein
MFKFSRFRWTAEHVMAVVTRRTDGRLGYHTVADLRLLQSYLEPLQFYTQQVREAMGDRLRAALSTVPSPQIIEELGLDKIEASAAVWNAGISKPEDRTNLNIRAVLEYVPFRNPLIEAWELKQLLRMYEAAGGLLEDTICDLIVELRDTRPAGVLAEASHTLGRIDDRVAMAREKRGGPGDPRRMPSQIF